ncbi:unnamed protein product [Cylindrotheca closterium]|uniref:Uncharacterized protein n=1 Tax=Cylindrotheca closterium TaxID=2856 RepID=A0AAD2JHD0_9STRA|nr:unnamed protein product [Cylindrotheca closterium]
MLEIEPIAPSHPSDVQRKYPSNAVLQSEQQRIVVLQLLRMLNASQQLNDEKINCRRQLQKVMRMLNRERKMQSDLHAVNDLMVKELRERMRQQNNEIAESSERKIQAIDMLCQHYSQQNLELQQQLSRLRRTHSEDFTTCKNREILKAEKDAEERIKMKHELQKLKELHKQQKDHWDIEIAFLKEKTRRQERESLLASNHIESDTNESFEGEISKKIGRTGQSRDRSTTASSSLDLRELEEEKRALQNQVNETQENYSALLAEMDYLQKVHGQATKDLGQTLKRLEEQKQVIETELLQMQESDMQHRNEVRESRAQIALLEEERDAARTAQTGLSRRLQESESTSIRLAKETSKLATLKQSLEEEKAKLETELSQMQESDMQHRNEVRESRAQIALLEEERDAARTAQTGFSRRLRESESTSIRLAKETSKLATLKQSLEEEKAKLETELSQMQESDMQHRNEVRESRAQIALLEEEHDAARAAQTGLSRRLQESESTSIRLAEETSKLATLKQSLEEEKAKLETELSQMQESDMQHRNEARESRAQIALLEEERDAARTAQTGLSEHLQESESTSIRLAKETSNLATLKQSLEEEKAKLETELSQMQESDMQHRNEVRESRAQIALLEEERDAARTAQTGLSRRLQESESTSIRLAKETSKLATLKQSLEEEKAKLETELSQMQESDMQHRNEVRESRAQIALLEEERDAARTAQTGFSRRLRESESTSIRLAKETSKLATLKQSLEEEKAKLETELSQMQESDMQHRNEVRESRAQIALLEEEHDAARAAQTGLSRRLQESESTSIRLAEETSKLATLKQSLEEEKAKLETELSQMQESDMQHRNEARESRAQIALLEEERDAARTAQTGLSEHLQESESTSIRLAKETSNLATLKQSLEEEKAKLETELSQMQESDMQHRNEVRESRAQIALLEEERDAARTAQTGLSRRLQESESTSIRLAKETSKLATLKQSLEEEKAKLETELSQMQESDMQHRNEVRESRAQIALLEEERDTARTAQTGLSEHLQESESTSIRLAKETSKLAILKQSLEEEKAKLETGLSQMHEFAGGLGKLYSFVQGSIGEEVTIDSPHIGDLVDGGSSDVIVESVLNDSRSSNIARKGSTNRTEAFGSPDSAAHASVEMLQAGGTEALPGHDSRNGIAQQLELVKEKVLLEDGIETESSQSSGEKYLQTTGRMEALAREIEGEGGVRISNENLEMDELRMQCHFLEHDRSELARVTNEILAMEREFHALELDAAVASARRQSMEDFQLFQQKTHHQMKKLYKSLCGSCRNRIDRA